MRFTWALFLFIACSGEPAEEAPAPHVARDNPAPRAPAEERRCGADRAYEGGEVLETPDGARLYYRVAGPEDAPPLLFLHGGPGLNTYSFERTAGPLLERSLRMIYVDQRGCGRSAGGRENLPLGMDPTVADLERLREHLHIARWNIAAHSYGGMVALAYLARHDALVDKLVMIEATAELTTALENQVQTLAQDNAALTAVANDGRPALDRLYEMYQTLGPMEAQRRMHWATDEGQTSGERWSRESRLSECTREGVLPSFAAAGWTDTHADMMRPLGHPTILIAGRQSRVLGAELAQRTATAWDAELVWMEHSAHFPFVEEPEPFATAVIAFLRP
jgi:proline iminopeptidase